MEDDQELFSFNKHMNIEDVEYVDLDAIEDEKLQEELEKKPLKNRHQYKAVDRKEMEENLEHLYLLK